MVSEHLNHQKKFTSKTEFIMHANVKCLCPIGCLIWVFTIQQSSK